MQNQNLSKTYKLILSLLIFSLYPLSLHATPFVLVLSQDDLTTTTSAASLRNHSLHESPEREEFDDSDSKPEEELDPGTWRPIFEPDSSGPTKVTETDSSYYSAVLKMLSATSGGADVRLMKEAMAEIEAAAMIEGNPHAQSVLGFLYGMGMMQKRNTEKEFLHHYFAAEGGNMQSKMALAYTYLRQKMYEEAVKLYAELAEIAVNSFLISKVSPVIEPVRIHNGAEENKELLRKMGGEEDEDFQILKHQVQQGNAGAMYKVGLFYYFGLRGLRRDHGKALWWFNKAVEKGEVRSMELLGEIYARGTEVERNYTKAL